MADSSYQELATNIRRNLRHLARDMAGLAEAHRFIDYINHMDTLAQQIENATATPPADAALADRVTPSLIIHYGQVQQENEKLREEIAALRARQPAKAVAVPDYLVCAIEEATHPKYGTYLSIERRNALADALKHAMLAASKGEKL